MRYCGRDFTKEEISWIRQLIANRPDVSRKDISVLFCREFNWFKPDGGLKDMSCRVAMLKMEKDGHFILPLPKKKHTKPYKKIRTLWTLEQPEIYNKAGDFNLKLELVDNRGSALWNEFIDRYHYLGYKTLPGAQLRYFVKADNQILGYVRLDTPNNHVAKALLLQAIVELKARREPANEYVAKRYEAHYDKFRADKLPQIEEKLRLCENAGIEV